VAIVAVVVLAVGCGGGSSATSTSTLATSDTATVNAETNGVRVNGVEVSSGGTQPVQVDEPVVTGERAKASVRVAEVDISLDETTEMRLVSWDRPKAGAWLESGQLVVTLSDDPDARVELETSVNVVLRTLQPGTEFWVCQTPPKADKQGTCLFVYKGEVEWEAKGNVQRFHTGQGTFSPNGDPALPARCPSLEAFDQWKQATLGFEDAPALDGLIAAAPPCPDGVPAESTTSSTATEVTATTAPTTSGGGQSPPTTRRPRPTPPPTGTPAPGTPAPPPPPETTPTTPETTPTTPETTPTTPETTPTTPETTPPTTPIP
jgi:hypothetical protein